MQKNRQDIPSKYRWRLDKMYANDQLWEEDFQWVDATSLEMEQYSGKLTQSDKMLQEALDRISYLLMKMQTVYTFARMKRDEDNTQDNYQMMADKGQSLVARVSARLSFFEPELIEAGRAKTMALVDSNPALELYRFMLEEIYRNEPHTLSDKEEKLISKFQEVLSASDDIFTMINNADMDFGTIEDEHQQQVPLTHGSYGSFIESFHRPVRQNAYEGLYKAFKKQKNTIATTLGYSVKGDALMAEIKQFGSSLEMGLHGDNIPTEVYHNLIQVVNQYLPVLHRYLEIRRKIMKLDKLRPFDLYVPLVQLKDDKISYEQGIDHMMNALKPLGKEYLDQVKQGLDEGWIDVYETKGKTSGAYSFGSYESMPYILLNYQDRLRDVFTLVHEMGHSMHSYYSRQCQPSIYGGHSIFTAEVASTVNEALLIQYLMDNAKNDEEKLYLINTHLEGFRTTLFRQTMFAEFELLTHEAVEKGQPLTAENLCAIYLELNKKYFGPAVELDDDIAMEWARIPHFYSAFYVYKYATGYSAANAISHKILKEGQKAAEQYIEFLKSGKSDYPVELLKIAGVDMSKKESIELAMEAFEELVCKMEELIEK